MENPDRVLAAIDKMLSAFPPLNVPGTADEVLRRYVEAVEDRFDIDIEGGVDLIVKGKVPGYSGAFAPTPPQFATAVRIAQDQRVSREMDRRPRLPPPDVVRTAESMARVRSMTEEIGEKLVPSAPVDKAGFPPRDLEREVARDRLFADEFITDRSGRKISRSLAKLIGHVEPRAPNFTAGDPDGDRDVA